MIKIIPYGLTLFCVVVMTILPLLIAEPYVYTDHIQYGYWMGLSIMGIIWSIIEFRGGLDKGNQEEMKHEK